MSEPPAATVRFHATRQGWRILELGGATLGLFAPLLSRTALEQVLEREGSVPAVLDALTGRTELAAFSHDPRDGFRLHTDLNRSHPLYWRGTGDVIEASDDHRVLASAPAEHRSALATEQFAYSGFTLGARTLHDQVRCVPADADVHLGPGRIRIVDRARMSLPGPGAVDEAEAAGDVFLTALRSAVEELLAQNPRAHLLLPLSGGSDSRLLALVLKDLAPERVSAFTYGVRGSQEVRASRAVATALGIPWQVVELSAPAIREQWRAPENASFLARAHAGNALPHVQDWYALARLHDQGLLDEDTIVLPGHTAARSYTPPRVQDPDGACDREQILGTLLAYHFNQRSAVPGPGPVRDRLVAALQAELPPGADRVDDLAAARLLQRFNIQHRQVKYILNSARTYEHFGARWSMPLLDPRCHRALDGIDWSIRRSKQWYRDLTDREMHRLAGDLAAGIAELGGGPERPSTSSPGRLGRRVGALARSADSVRTNLAHPMAFQAFAPSRREYAALLAQRFSPLGIFAQAFLDGRWNPSYRWDDATTWGTPSVISLTEFFVPGAAL